MSLAHCLQPPSKRDAVGTSKCLEWRRSVRGRGQNLSLVSGLFFSVFLLSGKLQSKVMKSKVLGRDFLTGLLSSLGVRGSCWLVSVASECCSDTVETKKQEKLKMFFYHFTIAVFFAVFFFFLKLFFLSVKTHSQALRVFLARAAANSLCTCCEKQKNKKMSIKTKRNSNLFVFLKKKKSFQSVC